MTGSPSAPGVEMGAPNPVVMTIGLLVRNRSTDAS
jgi:hypothetical protein